MAATAEWKPVKLSEIGKGLTTLWSELGAQTATRVCTNNLVVFLDGESRLDEAVEATRVASEAHPIRAIFILCEPEADEHSTQGRLSGYCRLTDSGGVHICCEQIVLTARGRAVERLASSVASLLVPDLPVILWWLGGKSMERLLDISDRLVVDSKEVDLSVVETLADDHPQVSLGDLNWIRIDQWRELTADLFDDTRFLPYLSQIGKLDIRYAKGSSSQAQLFAGWFRSRTVNHQPVAINHSGIEGVPAEPGELAAVNIVSDDRKAFFSLTVNARHEIESIAEIQGERAYYRTSPMESVALGKLIACAIEEGPDPLYKEALR